MSSNVSRIRVLRSAILAFLIASVIGSATLLAQTVEPSQPVFSQDVEASSADKERFPFSVETLKIEGGAELVTIFYRTNGTFDKPGPEESKFVPLLSVLRDTLGDEVMKIERLRDVWMLTYTKPSTMQKLMAAIPFNYRRWGSKQEAGKTVPPPIA